MADPVRLQLSRAKGFNLQAHSMNINGLPAVNVARPSKWGNPFKIGNPYPAAEEAVRNFRFMIKKHGFWWPNPMPLPKGKIPAGELTTADDIVKELRGKNLACWCRPDEPCHADVLLDFANRDRP